MGLRGPFRPCCSFSERRHWRLPRCHAGAAAQTDGWGWTNDVRWGFTDTVGACWSCLMPELGAGQHDSLQRRRDHGCSRTSEPGGESVSTDTDMPPNHHQAFILRHLGSPLGARTCPPTTSSSAARAVLVVVRASDWPRALVSVVPAGAYTSCSWPPLAPLASLEA